jgi:hypothetical protein
MAEVLSPSPDMPPEQIYTMLDQLKEREGVLLPNWWSGSPETFLDRFGENILSLTRNLGEAKTVREQQYRTLEVLLNMWEDHLYGTTT